MPDDNQSTATDDNQSIDQDAERVANEALEQSGGQDLGIPNFSDIEYATPSAYIDPDLPAYNPDGEQEEEQPEEEEEEDDVLSMTPEQIAEYLKQTHEVMAKVAEKIANSANILIATSSDPSLDELSTAITLARFLDRLGKHTIAIYSGEVPNALAFLDPSNYFENDVDVLQDFVVSLNKEKADHLHYKLEGEEVKVFITPYRERITEEDLSFSYCDYNVDLVLALNVNNGKDLDPALNDYGHIMKDATIINISTGNPGKFGEMEWNNKRASSVSEMVADLLCNASGDVKLEPIEATALLTGIVASTDRFAHANTFSTTMQIASRLIDFGASPETVAENITDDVDNQFFTFSDLRPKKDGDEEDLDNPSFSFKPTEEPKNKIDPDDPTTLAIKHGDEEEFSIDEDKSDKKIELDDEDNKIEKREEEAEPEEKRPETPNIPETHVDIQQPEPEKEPENSALLDELKATEASLSGVGAEANAIPEVAPAPEPAPSPEPIPNIPTSTPEPLAAAPAESPVIETPTPLSDFSSPNKYSQMLEEALAEPASGASASMDNALPPVNPAASVAPEVPASPEVTSMPDINYGQNSDQLLPPPPTPPVDINSPMPIPASPEPTPAPSPAPAPSTPATPPAPDAFTIPGV